MTTTLLPTITPVVDAISNLSFSGNILPPHWLKKITMSNGKPDLAGVIILSDIIYWYRAREIRDEGSGALTGRCKRFKADKLQRSVRQLSEQFGLTMNQVRDALARLQKGGYITKELRTVETDGGAPLLNVLFIEPVPEAIKDLVDSGKTPVDYGSSDINQHDLGYIQGRPRIKDHTYTETTTETTTSTTNVGDAAASPTKALPKKKARKEPNPDGSYGDPDVTAVCAYFKEKLSRTRIDKSDKWNRIMASNLLRGEPDGLAGVKRLIDRLAQDDFWPPNITSLHDLYDKREKITQRGLAREASQQATNTAVTVDEQGIIRGQGFIDISNITSSGN